MFGRFSGRFVAAFAMSMGIAGAPAHALERVTYTSGMQDTFVHHQSLGDVVRFYKSADDTSWQDVPSERVFSINVEADAKPLLDVTSTATIAPSSKENLRPTMAEVTAMLTEAADMRSIDKDLLASVVKIESGFRVDARSRAGATGLMQLMPGTAKQMGVSDATHPTENLKGGAAYFDALLKQYHDDIPLALAAYNAGPAAVAKYHGVPPYRETQWYIYRVIKEYNSRVKQREAAAMVSAR